MAATSGAGGTPEIRLVAARHDPDLERRTRGVRRERDARVVLPDQAVGPPRFVADEAAERALAFADDEAGSAAHLLGDPVRDLGQVVQVEAEVVGPGAGLGAPVLDDLEVVGLAEAARLGERLARARRRAPRSSRCRPHAAAGARPAARRSSASCRSRAPGRARPGRGRVFELAGVVAGAHDVEREVLEHPDADTVAFGRRAVRAAEQAVVDRLGGASEAVAVEGAVDDGRDPPAGDRVLAELEETGRHRSDPGQRRAKSGSECAGEDARGVLDRCGRGCRRRLAPLGGDRGRGRRPACRTGRSGRSRRGRRVTLSAMPW